MSQPETFEALLCLLRNAHNADLPAPEVINEDDGEICFDWGTASRRVLSVSVRRDGRFSWAALIGDWNDHGTCWAGVDARLLEAMKRLAAAENAAAA